MSMESPLREPGFYWVKDMNEWTIGEYAKNGYWWLICAEEGYLEHELAEIGPKVERSATVSTPSIPYQLCPKCNGSGQCLADGFTSSIYKVCDVCSGAKIIPQYVPASHEVSTGWVSTHWMPLPSAPQDGDTKTVKE